MEQWKGRVAIVTGASSGIGREVAKQLALNGMIVIGCARNQSRIEVLSITVDLFYSQCTSVVYDQIYKYCDLDCDARGTSYPVS